MSEDGLSDGFEEPTMEIQIKTLLGTTFDMKVSSMDTIEDIKKKIYRIEGIPIYQQSLIFEQREMKDTFRLADAGIRHGSELTLVTLMRGGPISTRRLSVTAAAAAAAAACEHHVMLKELKEILDNTREEISPGSKVSVLVFKEGEVINLLRVIENEDGSYSPYSGSSSGGEKPISPPAKPSRKRSPLAKSSTGSSDGSGGTTTAAGIFEKLVEDNEMSNKMAELRQRMDEVHKRRMMHNTSRKSVNKPATSSTSIRATTAADEEIFSGASGLSSSFGDGSNSCRSSSSSKLFAYKFLSHSDAADLLDNVDHLKIYEKEENEEEIALKDKHRSNLHKLAKTKMRSLYSESKGACSHTKQNYARIHKRSRDMHAPKSAPTEEETTMERPRSLVCVCDEDDSAFRGTSVSLPSITTSPTESSSVAATATTTSAAGRIHLARLVLSDPTADRVSKTATTNSIGLEDNDEQEVWEIRESAGDRLKRSATCKLGVLKRRQSIEYGFDADIDIENHRAAETAAATAAADDDGPTDFSVCSGNLTYHHRHRVSQLATATAGGGGGGSTGSTTGGGGGGGGGGVAQDHHHHHHHHRSSHRHHAAATTTASGICDYYFTAKQERSPLYGRGGKAEPSEDRKSHEESSKYGDGDARIGSSFLSDCSGIQRLKNDSVDCEGLFAMHDQSIDDLYGYYNLGCSPDLLGERIVKTPKKGMKVELLPPVIKKKARCNECNKRLNITNIYDCRCGKIFCSQHRYSEVHRCSYDYKLEGRRILEKQNPLVAAEKISKI